MIFNPPKIKKLKAYALIQTRNALCALISFYQSFLSPNFGKNCRFYPTCSEYSYRAIKKYGMLKGSWKGVKRILKCHPWHSGGIDLP